MAHVARNKSKPNNYVPIQIAIIYLFPCLQQTVKVVGNKLLNFKIHINATLPSQM